MRKPALRANASTRSLISPAGSGVKRLKSGAISAG